MTPCLAQTLEVSQTSKVWYPAGNAARHFVECFAAEAFKESQRGRALAAPRAAVCGAGRIVNWPVPWVSSLARAIFFQKNLVVW